MAACNAMRCNPTTRAFAERLKEAVKPLKVVATARMRKLLTILNLMVKTNQRWNPELSPTTAWPFTQTLSRRSGRGEARHIRLTCTLAGPRRP